MKDQEKFLSVIQKSVHEAKSNLKNVEKYASECSKNIGLWYILFKHNFSSVVSSIFFKSFSMFSG